MALDFQNTVTFFAFSQKETGKLYYLTNITFLLLRGSRNVFVRIALAIYYDLLLWIETVFATCD